MLNDLFDCIFVINLAYRNDRRLEMEDELKKVGLSLLNGSAEILSASRFSEPGDFDSAGARGCFDSHLRALKMALERNSNGVLIFEDDCDFAPYIQEKLPNVLRQLAKTEWSIFYGGHLSEVTTSGSIGGISRIAPEQGLCGAHFIAVSGKALPMLSQYLEAMLAREPGSPLGGPMHVDGAYSWFRKDHPACDTWVADPQLGFQRPSRTDIHQLKFYDRIIGLRQSAAYARRLKRKFLN